MTKQKPSGHYIVTTTMGESVRAFVPMPLPPERPLDLDSLHPLLDRANQAVGRLDAISTILPDTNFLISLSIHKEALISSQIEGTQSSLSDLLLFENQVTPTTPMDDIGEVLNYVAAMQYGLERVKGGFPISLRLIREIHGILLRGGRGSDQTPGEFRRSQNWIGGTRPGNAAYVPPPPDKLMECLDNFEKFLHDENQCLPMLVQIGLLHVQFETIHPFLDGNGRLGRLLITLLLCTREALQEPLLYLSLYFKTHRATYYELLQRVRTEEEWEPWLTFFLEGVESTAKQATTTAKQLLRVFEEDREKIQQLGRSSLSVLRIQEYMQKHPYCMIGATAQALGLSIPTVATALRHLQELQIVREVTGKGRNRLYVYTRSMKLLEEGTEPLAP